LVCFGGMNFEGLSYPSDTWKTNAVTGKSSEPMRAASLAWRKRTGVVKRGILLWRDRGDQGGESTVWQDWW
jgi:hypothetical protein